MASLFIELTESAQKVPAILVIDSSGSTVSESAKFDGKLIFDKMAEITSKINNDNFRVIFWNSDAVHAVNNEKFPGGIIRPMHVIKKESLPAIFGITKSNITNMSLTYPHLGFNSIPKEWIDPKEPTHVYFVTDGKIGYNNIQAGHLHELKVKLKDSIESLFKKFGNIQLHIITVESLVRDFDSVETMSIAAGGDVFEVIQDNGLTKYITEFVSYSLNHVDGYKHINTVIPPAGFVPFGQKCFSETKTGEFIEYIYEFVQTHKDNESELLKIVQNLSGTLRALTKDKPAHLTGEIVKTFCNIFNGTVIDSTIVEFMLADTVKLESQGKAIVFAEYRAKLKDLYKQAQELLTQNTKKSIGISDRFISFPIGDKVVTGHRNLITETMKFGKANYPSSCIKVDDNFLVPVFTLLESDISPINEQCLRQYIRAIINKQFGVNVMDDIVIYVAMSQMLRVVVSDVPEKYKNAFRKLATIMLKKKRLSTDITELAKLEEGGVPIPNDGKVGTFYGYMSFVNKILDTNYAPMTMWYMLCLALGNESIINKQLIHCVDALKADFADVGKYDKILDTLKDKIKPISVHEIPDEAILEYKCIVTLEDVSLAGGHKINPHSSLTGSQCSPFYVVSNDGYDMMFSASSTAMCPQCYKGLTKDDFCSVAPKPVSADIVFGATVENPFAKAELTVTGGAGTHDTLHTKATKPGVLVVMKGTVGAGKTTFSEKLQDHIKSIGGYCTNEGTDKYCKTGVPTKTAAKMVGNELRKAFKVPKDINVVIIDTCGDRDSEHTTEYFGVNFAGWKKITVYPNYDEKMFKGYLSWSLRNVLNRGIVDKTTNYYLSPMGAGVQVCLDVHKGKSMGVFSKYDNPTSKTTKEAILAEINKEADEYAKYLAESMTLDDQIKKVTDQIAT